MKREADSANKDVLPKRTRHQCKLINDSHKINGTKPRDDLLQEIEMKDVGDSKEIVSYGKSCGKKNAVKIQELVKEPLSFEPSASDTILKSRTKKVKEETSLTKTNDDDGKKFASEDQTMVTKGKGNIKKNSSRTRNIAKIKEETVEEDDHKISAKETYVGNTKKPKSKKVKVEVIRTDDDDDSGKKIGSEDQTMVSKGKGNNKKNSSRTRNVAKIKDEIVEEEDHRISADEPSVISTKKSKSKKVKVEVVRTATERSIVKKGLAAVDGLCPIANVSHVYCEGADIWDCMLNQTNIQFNNNKYYLIQLLKDDNKETFSVWMRWGRVGCTGQNSLKPFASNLSKAKDTFMKKFNDKTKNDWEMRHCFEKVPGKYDLLQMDYSEDTVDNIKKEEENTLVPHKKVESRLEPNVKALVELICDVRAMEEAVVEMKYDAKKAPLGKLTADQVNAGYAALKQIDDIISENCNASNRSLLEACNAFYTRIPHYFGMKVPPLIRTKSEIQQKISLLQALGDIQAAMSILSKPIGEGIHPADQHYDGLGVDIQSLKKNSSEYKMLEKYLNSTHGSTHTMYKMEIVEIFKVTKSSEVGKFKDYGNRMLLWHGSRLTNFAGILSKGLRIAPPEAPTTGYMVKIAILYIGLFESLHN